MRTLKIGRHVSEVLVKLRRVAGYLRAELLCWTGFVWWAKLTLRHEGAIVVLMLHRVLTREEWESTSSEPEIIIKHETFRSLVRHAKLSCEITQLETFNHNSSGAKEGGQLIAITLDDGWHDNYTSVLPVALAEAIPLTIFVCPGLVGCHLPFWPERISRALKTKAPELRHAELKALIEQLKDFDPDRRDFLIGTLSRQNGTPSFRAPQETDSTLSWDEIMEMNRAGIRFGSHSCTHRILPKLPVDEVQREVLESKLALDSVLRNECSLFAYPNGDHSQFTRTILAEAGYRAAVTTECGAWTRDGDRLAIPRVNISEQTVTGLNGRFSRAMFDYTVFWRAYRNLGPRRKRRPALRSVTS